MTEISIANIKFDKIFLGCEIAYKLAVLLSEIYMDTFKIIQKVTALFLFAWFITVALLFTVPAFRLLNENTGGSTIDKPVRPEYKMADVPKVDFTQKTDTFQHQSKRIDQLNDIYKAQMEVYKSELTTYQTQSAVKSDFGAHYKQVTDAFASLLATLLTAFLVFAGINGTGQLMEQHIAAKASVASTAAAAAAMAAQGAPAPTPVQPKPFNPLRLG